MKGEVCKIGFARCSIYALICCQNAAIKPRAESNLFAMPRRSSEEPPKVGQCVRDGASRKKPSDG